MGQGLGQGGGRNVMGVVGGGAGVRARRWEKCNGSSVGWGRG